MNINNGGSGGTSSAIGTGALTISGTSPVIDNTSGSAVTLSTNNAQNWNANFTFTGTNNLNLGSGAVTLNANRTVTTTAGTLTVGGAIGGGAFGITKAGAGTLVLSNAASTYTGATTINAGVLSVSTLANGGGNSSIGASTNNATNLVIDGGTLQYTGATVSTDRKIKIGNTTAGGAATLDASGSGALTFSATGTSAFSYGTTNQTRALILTGANTGSNTLAGSLTDNGTGATTVTKSGAGTWVLSGTNTYTGATTISSGTLTAGGNSAFGTSAVTVNSGGTVSINSGVVIGNTLTLNSGSTIKGGGTVSSATTVSGNIAPGNSAGNLTFGNGLTLNSGSTYVWELGSLTTSGGGTNFDLITISGGNLTIVSGAILSLSLSTLAPQNNDPFWNTNRSWTIISNSGSITGTALTIDNPAWSGYGSFATGANGSNLDLNWTAAAIPEPSTWAVILGAVALAGMLIRRRRRQHAA